MDKDHLVKPEDVILDALWKAIEASFYEEDINMVQDVDYDKFFGEINGRSKRLRVDLAFKILGAKGRAEFEEMVHDLYALGLK